MSVEYTIPKISVIVPVYNAEKSLCQCIDSILALTFTDFELLLIDDGSKDSSGIICDEYVRKDSRIRVFHKENGGVSSARNLGLDNARGQWITFVDSDDKLFSTAFNIDWENIYGNLILFPFVMKFENNDKIIYPKQLMTNKENYLSQTLDSTIMRVPWSKLYSRKHIGDLRFDTSIKIGEDTLFNLEFYKRIEIIQIENVFVYEYSFIGNDAIKYCLTPFYSIEILSKIFHSYIEQNYKSLPFEIKMYYYYSTSTNISSISG